MERKFSERIKEKARRIAEDDTQLGNLINQVKQKVEKLAQNEKLQELFNTIQLFIRMIKSYLSGEYREIPKRTVLLILFGLIYFLIPIDMIPDFIPVSGFLDDLTVLLWVYKSIQKDIEAFQNWEKPDIATND